MSIKLVKNNNQQEKQAKQVRPELNDWYQTPLGQQLMQAEKAHLDLVLPTLFGYHLIQLGSFYDETMLEASRVSHCCVMDTVTSIPAQTNASFSGLPHALPLANDSVDVVVLPHTLEFTEHPHAVLREVERVLVPEGHIVMLLFNPWSLWMLRRLLWGWRKQIPWCGRFIGSPRSRDWLELLGFDVTYCERYFFRPPLQQHRLMNRLKWLEAVGQRLWPLLGGSYILVAKKRVETLTPIRPRWSARQRVVATGLIESMEQHRGKIANLYRSANGEG